MSYTYDIKAEKWLSIWKLFPQDPDYYERLFKYFKSLCASAKKWTLIDDLDHLIREKMGTTLPIILYVYKNLPYLNAMTKSQNPDYPYEYVYKHDIKAWLDEIEAWIFRRCVDMEKDIRFKDSQKIM